MFLRAIWTRNQADRTFLAEQTGITLPSATRVVRDLREKGLIKEIQARSGNRGPPIKLIEIDADGAYSFGVSFSHRHMTVGLMDAIGKLRAETHFTFDAPKTALIARYAQESIDQLSIDAGIDPAKIQGIGFAVPGDFRERPNFIHPHPFFPEFCDVHLGKTLGGDLPIDVFIENDCNSAAIGEHMLGHGRRYPTFFNVFVCHGIGGGIVIDGDLYSGFHGNAGGLHAFFPADRPRPSGQDLLRRLTEGNEACADFPDLAKVSPRADAIIAEWIARAGAQLRDALNVTTRIVDPAAIVIGGRLPPPLLERLSQVIDTADFCADPIARRPKVLPSALGPTAGVVGAAAVVFYRKLLKGDQVDSRQLP